MAVNQEQRDKRSLYQVVIDDILKKIHDNRFSFEKPLCTEKQLMEDYSISRITAKRAITELEHKGILYRKRGLGSYVSRDIYSRPSRNANEDTRIFAFVLPFDITKGGLFETVQTLNNILSAENHYMCIYIADLNNSKEKSILKQLLKQNVAGIVFYPMTNNIHLELLNMFIINNKPVVIIDKGHDCQYINNVLSDNFNGGVLLTEHLLSLGHTNIAYLSRITASGLTSICDRFGGYLQALKNAGLVPKEEYVIANLSNLYKTDNNPDQCAPSVIETVENLYSMGVTAIETENDEVAFSVMQACRELSIKVPEEMSICGFDNSEWAHMSELGITTIKQNFHDIGSNVAGIFLDSIKDSHRQPKKIVVPVELFVQGSTGPVKSSREAESYA